MDGGLRKIFAQNFSEAMWQSVETWSTGQGVPDVHYIFPNGISGWIEYKKTTAWAIDIDKEQSAWLERYARLGGRCFIAVRRQTAGGPRHGPPVDELWLFRGADARALMLGGLRAAGLAALVRTPGGPAAWDWQAVKAVLTRP